MFKQAISSAIAAINDIFTSPSSTAPSFHSHDAAVPFFAGSPLTRYLTATSTSTSPLSVLFAMAPEFAYHGLQIFLVLALVFSFLPVLSIVQHVAISVSIARNNHVRELAADANTKDARIRELESQAQQERQQKTADIDSMTQLKKQLSDANALVDYERVMKTSLEKKLERGQQKGMPSQATTLRMSTRHTEYVKKIRVEHETEKSEAIKVAVAETEARVKSEIKDKFQTATKILDEYYYTEDKIRVLKETVAKQSAQLCKAQRECDDKLEMASKASQQSNQRKVNEMQKEIDRRQKDLDYVREELRASNDRNHALQQKLDDNDKNMEPKTVVTALEGRIKELEHIIATTNTKVNSERAAASTREKDLFDTIAGDRAIYQAHADAAHEQKKKNIETYNAELEARNTKITTLETRVMKLHQGIKTKDAQLADIKAEKETLKTEVSVLQAAQAEQVSTTVLKQWIKKYEHEKFTSKRYRNEFSKCLNKMDRRQAKLEHLRSICHTLMKENTHFMNDNINLLTALGTEAGNCKALQQQVKEQDEQVRADGEEIANQEWNIRNLSQTMEEEIAELRPFPIFPLPPLSVPYENPMAVEPMDTSADVPKATSVVIQVETEIQTLDPSQTIPPTMTPILHPMESKTQVVAQDPHPQSFDPFDLIPALQPLPTAPLNEFDDMINWDAIDMTVNPADVFNLPLPVEQSVLDAEDPTQGIPNADQPVIDDEMPTCPDSQLDALHQELFRDDNDYDGDDEDVEWEDVLPAPLDEGVEEASKGKKRELE
ncbi:MAG: hypothetical protein Q9188_005836 [Gyalolechia gomerana]